MNLPEGEQITIAHIEAEIDKTYEHVITFIEKNKAEGVNSSTYEDWNYKDVIAHITEWIMYSTKRLDCIKHNRPIKDIDDVEHINNTLYSKNRDKKITTVSREFEEAIIRYKNVIEQYSEEDLLRKNYPTGFDIELWRYIFMDGAIHPHKHLLYHYLKRRRYEEFVRVVEETEDIFALYSKNNMRVYSFGEYEDKSGMIERNIQELSKENSNNAKVKKVVEANVRSTRFRAV